MEFKSIYRNLNRNLSSSDLFCLASNTNAWTENMNAWTENMNAWTENMNAWTENMDPVQCAYTVQSPKKCFMVWQLRFGTIKA